MSDLLAAVVRLVRTLRERGIRVTPRDAIHAAESLGAVDLLDRDEVRLTLRVVLLSRPEDFEVFDEVFDSAWDLPGGAAPPPSGPGQPQLTALAPKTAAVTLKSWMRPDDPNVDTGSSASVRSPSDHEVLASRDFSSWRPSDEAEFAAIAAQLARRLQLRRSRRWRRGRGGRVDLRATLRAATRTHGEPLVLRRRERKIQRTRLLVLCDVSGSMEPYAAFLLQLAHALQNTFATVESFVFATRLSRVTDRLRYADYRTAMAHLGRDVRDWSGGTRIGAAVATLVSDYRRYLDRRTVVILLSDGWDIGDPTLLSDALADLRRLARKLIWLNPLMGAADFSPSTRGMQAALPHIDVLAPGHNLESLASVLHELSV